MTQNEILPGSVLFVDDNKGIRDVFALVAESAGIDNVEIYEDADSAEDRLKTSDAEVSAVLSDGLNGGWRQVVTAAKEARVPAFVFSSDKSLQDEVELEGVAFFPKERLSRSLLLRILTEIQPSPDD